jgi:hypothetical protein
MSWRTIHHFYGKFEVFEDQNPLASWNQKMHVLAVVIARSDAPRDHTLEHHRHVRLVPLGDVSDFSTFQGDLLPQIAWGESGADELAEVRNNCLWLGVPPEAQLNPHSLPGHAPKLAYSVGINHDTSFLSRRSSMPLLPFVATATPTLLYQIWKTKM